MSVYIGLSIDKEKRQILLLSTGKNKKKVTIACKKFNMPYRVFNVSDSVVAINEIKQWFLTCGVEFNEITEVLYVLAFGLLDLTEGTA